MGKSIAIRTDESLVNVLERIQREVALDLKRKYNLSEVTISGNMASRVLAAKMNGVKSLNFNIRKIGLSRGILELV